jgi:hypothetical protein
VQAAARRRATQQHRSSRKKAATRAVSAGSDCLAARNVRIVCYSCLACRTRAQLQRCMSAQRETDQQ